MATVNALVDYEYKVSGAERSAASMQGLISTAALLAVAYKAARAAVDYFSSSIQSAIDANEDMNKFLVVMGDNANQVSSELEDFAEASNNSAYELRALAAGLQDMLVPMGVARNEAAQMSTDFVTLATDMSSFNNVPVGETLAAIQSALAGQSRPLRRFGVDTRVAALESQALAMGIHASWQEMTQAQQAQVLYAKVVADTADAQGDAARTADQAAGVMRGLRLAFEDSKIAVGDKFLPAIEKLGPLLEEQLGEILPEIVELGEQLASFMEEHGPLIIDIIGDMAIIFVNAAGAIIEFIDKVISGAASVLEFQNNLTWLGDTANWLVNPIGAATGSILKFAQTYADAERALNQWDDTANRATVTEQVATLVTGLYADAMEGTTEQAEYLIHQLEVLESQGANTGTILDNLRARHEELTHEIEIGNLVVGELTAKTADLTIEQINDARAAIKLALAQEQLNASMSVGPTLVAARIAELIEYREELDRLASSFDSGNGGGAGFGGGGGMGMGGKPFDGQRKDTYDIKGQIQAQIDLQQALSDKTAEFMDMQQAREQAIYAQRMQAIQGIADRSINIIAGGFRNGFDGVLDDFKNMLADMAAEYLKSQFSRLLFGGVVKGATGGAGFFL